MKIPRFLKGLPNPVQDLDLVLTDALRAEVAARVMLDASAIDHPLVVEAHAAVVQGITKYFKRKKQISHASIARQINKHAKRRAPYSDQERKRFERLMLEIGPLMDALNAMLEPILRDAAGEEPQDIIAEAMFGKIVPADFAGEIQDFNAFAFATCKRLALDARRRAKKHSHKEVDANLLNLCGEVRPFADIEPVDWGAEAHDAIRRLPEGAPKEALELRLAYGDDPKELDRRIIERNERRKRPAKNPRKAHNEAYSQGVKLLREILDQPPD